MRPVNKSKGRSVVSFILSAVLLASMLSITGAPIKASAVEPFVKSKANTCLDTKKLSSQKAKDLTASLSANDTVLFTSLVSGTEWDDSSTYKFTIASGKLGIEPETATLVGDKVVIPYKLSGDDKAKINAVSLLITDMDPEKTKADIRVYDRLEATKDKNDNNKLAESGQVSFTLPDDYDDKTDCIFLLAETITDDNSKNDYAAISDQVTFKSENSGNGGSSEGGNDNGNTGYVPSTGYSSHLEYSSSVNTRVSYVNVTNLGSLTELELLKESVTDSGSTVQINMSFKPDSADPFLRLYLYRYRRNAGRPNYRTEFFDISIDKTVSSIASSKKSALSTTDEVLESALNFSSKISDVMILRDHEGKVTRFTRLRRRPAVNDYKDGTYYLNVKDKVLYIYSSKFSSFAIDYSIDKNASEDESVSVSTGSQASDSKASKDSTVAVYRLYNPVTKQHFFTIGISEKDSLLKAGWINEGIAFNVPSMSDSPVYRLLNVRTGEHYYTANASEKNSLIAKGWSYEYIAWYNDEAKTHKVYRLTLKNKPGVSHYTSSITERDSLIRSGWTSEDSGLFAK